MKKLFVLAVYSIQLCSLSLYSQEVEEQNILCEKVNLIVRYLENDEELLCYTQISTQRKHHDKKAVKCFEKKRIIDKKNSIYIIPFLFQYNMSEIMNFDCLNNYNNSKSTFENSKIAAFIFRTKTPNIIIVHLLSYKKRDKKKGESVFVSSYLNRYFEGTQLVYEFSFENDTIIQVRKSVLEMGI